MNTLPPTRRPIIRKIVEHIIHTISPHHHLIIFLSPNAQRAIYIKSGILMKIEMRTSPNRQRYETINNHSAIYNNRTAALYRSIFPDSKILA